jgi:cytochrome c551/c552
MKRIMLLIVFGILIFSCNNGGSDESTKTTATVAIDSTGEKIPNTGGSGSAYDSVRGVGKFTHLEISDKLDPALASGGEKIYGVKCSACHKITDEKLVGPGWKGVTARHRPEWIMNFVTNTDEMLSKDPKAQAQLEICLVRMPNQNLADKDARQLLEFMRKNDGVK